MATPVKQINPTDEATIDALTEVLQYIPDDNDDEIGIKRVAFIASLLTKASDDLFLWTQSMKALSPAIAARVAPNLRKDLDIAGAIATLDSELANNKDKLGGRMLETINLINGDDDLKTLLYEVYPQDSDVAIAHVENKVDEYLSLAKAIPIRIHAQLKRDGGDSEDCWRIEHGDGIHIFVPATHPDVSHLEVLHKEGTALTLSNIFKDNSTEDRKRTSSDAALDDPKTPSRTTRTQTVNLLMEKSRDDKVRGIKPKITERRKHLTRILPAMTCETIKFRSFGWAKYEIEYRNRFVPQELRAQVTQSVWDTLFGTKGFNLDTTELRNVDMYYQRYKDHNVGYDLSIKTDGRC